MSANFNVITFTDSLIDLNWLIRVTKEKGMNTSITKVESVKNWGFEELATHDVKISFNEMIRLLDNERIIIVGGKCGTYKCAMIICKVNNVYETSFSIDTAYKQILDSDTINEEIKPFYDEISNIIQSPGNVFEGLLYAAMGVEVVLNYSANSEEFFHNNHNVLRWLFGKQKLAESSYLKDYQQVSSGIWDKT